MQILTNGEFDTALLRDRLSAAAGALTVSLTVREALEEDTALVRGKRSLSAGR